MRDHPLQLVTHQVSEGGRGGGPGEAAAGQQGEREGGQWEAHQEYRQGEREVGRHRQVVLQPQVEQHGQAEQRHGVQLEHNHINNNVNEW